MAQVGQIHGCGRRRFCGPTGQGQRLQQGRRSGQRINARPVQAAQEPDVFASDISEGHGDLGPEDVFREFLLQALPRLREGQSPHIQPRKQRVIYLAVQPHRQRRVGAGVADNFNLQLITRTKHKQISRRLEQFRRKGFAGHDAGLCSRFGKHGRLPGAGAAREQSRRQSQSAKKADFIHTLDDGSDQWMGPFTTGSMNGPT